MINQIYILLAVLLVLNGCAMSHNNKSIHHEHPKISVGMTKEQVLSLWGDPTEVVRTADDKGVLHALWIYKGHYLDFEDEKLVGYQEKLKN